MSDNNITEKFQRINYYLIDYENVHQTGLNGIENLTPLDRLIIFYTENAESLTFPVYEKLVACKAEIQLHKVKCGGKNALDFQLATFLGYVLGNNPDTECHIISNDKGYEYVLNFWKEKNVIIYISSDIAGNVRQAVPQIALSPVPVTTVNYVPVSETDFNNAVKLLNLSESDKKKLLTICNGSTDITPVNKRQTQINNEIGRVFGSTNQKIYYKAIKPLIK
ncbi:MAG: hypothetical protein K2G36_12000 [Ruminococcus sp.]|nr:hypothetical protein [Ruminococcus sp.]